MASIRKKNGKWQVQVRRQGFPSVSKAFIKKSDAQEWARHMESQVDRRSLPQDPKQLDTITLKDMLERYRDEVITKKRCTDRETNLIEAFINRADEWVSLPLSRINAAHFSRYRDKRLQTLKPASVCRELGLIQHAYDIASKEWAFPLLENPVAKIKKPVINNRRERRLIGSELLSLFKGVKGCQNPHMRPLVLFALLTAMRRGEILALKWRYVSLETRTLHIPMSKNGHSRTIPLSGKALRVLRYLKQRYCDSPLSYVFPLTENTIKMAWQRMIRRSGIQDLHLHDLRHYAVSRFFERGLSVPEVALISGHRDFRILFRYTHLKPEAIAEKLNR